MIYFYVTAGGSAFTWVPFKRLMAKTPTVIGYSPASGAANTVRDYNASADKTATASNPNDAGFGGFTITSPNAGIWQAGFHYTADTGW